MAEATPFLWFDDQLQEAAEFWARIFPDTGLVETRSAGGGGGVVGGTVRILGRSFHALNGGPGHPFTDAISIAVECEDQAEIDRYWDGLTDGGTPIRCGWITDRFGLSWQITPRRLPELLGEPDPARAARAMAAMLGMVKLDLAELERAADGDA